MIIQNNVSMNELKMAHTSEDYKSLLLEAEKTIVSLKEELEAMKADKHHLEKAMNDMMEAQMLEAEQMVQLTEQCWTLEQALEEAQSEKAQVLTIVGELNDGLNDLKKQADTAIANAKQETSKVKLASELMHLANATKKSDIDKYLKTLTRS